AGEIASDQVRKMRAPAAFEPQRQHQHLVEIAVVDVALPVDREQRAAHHALDVVGAVRAVQQGHVLAELALGGQRRAEALDRHVGEGIATIEDDAEAITSTCGEARNSARFAWHGSSRIVRLQRSMTCTPSSRACTTSSRKWAFSSGAPPVMSRIRIEDIPINATTSATVSRDISSVRCGPALTWQCTQVWLHLYPTLTCRVSRRRRLRAGNP